MPTDLPYWVLLLRGLSPWQTRNAAENTYCVFCEPDDHDSFTDQNSHAAGCPYMAVPRCIACEKHLEGHVDSLCPAGGWTPLLGET